ncbi:uncharacterized protein LOC144625435 [Crassostrea virginica]
MAFYVVLMLLFSVCLDTTNGYRRVLCPTLSCPEPPDHCRQAYNYGWLNGRRCPVSCSNICACPEASMWDVRYCDNRDPYCHVYREYQDLPDGQRCLSKCRLACF